MPFSSVQESGEQEVMQKAVGWNSNPVFSSSSVGTPSALCASSCLGLVCFESE